MDGYNVTLIKECEKTFAARLELKANGPPRPDLKLTQICSSKTKTFTRVFKTEQYEKTPWLCGCDKSDKLYCFPCLLFGTGADGGGGESAWTETGVSDLSHLSIKIKKHSQSRIHLLNELQLASIGRQDIRKALDSANRKSIQEFNDRVDENRHILRRLIDCVVFCGAFQVALQGHDESTQSLNPGIYRGLVDFVAEIDMAVKQHLTSSSVFKGTSKSIQNDILDAIYEVCISEIQDQIRKSEFIAIQADETTDCSTVQQLVFIVRYVHDGKIYERFIKYLQPKVHTADLIAAEIIQELESLKIDKKLIGQSYDGASVMSGNLNGVQKFVRDKYPYAYYVHCYAHQLNLILERGASINYTIRSFFCNLHAFPSFFTHSPKRSEFLKEIVNRKIPAAPLTRWNHNSRTVIVVHDNVEPLKECMEAIMESPNCDSNTFNQAQSLLSYLNNEDFLDWLDFFATLMPHCETLFKFLQSRSIDSIKIDDKVSKFEKTVEELRNAVPPPSPKKKRRRNNLDHSITRKEICDVITAQIKDRFMYTDHLLASKLFFTDKFEDYNKNFPENEFKKVVSTFDFLENTKLKNELLVIYSREDFYNADGAVALLQHFIECNLDLVFAESIKLLKIICTIPMTSVESERCFSTINRVKTFTRNTMTQDRLNALCMISIEKRLINQIQDFHRKVIEVFAHKKERRMHFIYK